MAAEKLILCGMDEVFVIEASSTEKTWSWRAADRPEIPEGMRKTFATTDDIKVLDNGARWLITSSSGGCALLEYPSGKVLWQARVPNAHSIEALPGNLAVVASSVSKEGNRLALFDLRHAGGAPLSSTPLPSAHGVVWDEPRQRLWALGFDELRRYQLKKSPPAAAPATAVPGAAQQDAAQPAKDATATEGVPALELEATFKWSGKDGHDLQPVPGSDDLVLTDEAGVWLFDRKTESFRPHPVLGSRPEVKSVSIHPQTGRIAWTMASGGEWWTRDVQFLNPESKLTLPGEKLYKVRWLPDSPASVTAEGK